MIQVYIGLGSNLGNSIDIFNTVFHDLSISDNIRKCRISNFYRSSPICAIGPDFINAAIALETSLEPLILLNFLQKMEKYHGRVRLYKNSPRTLDLDLLLYNEHQIDEPCLRLPHPQMHIRAFVLRPLQDLAPELSLKQGLISNLLDQQSDQKIELLQY